MPLSVEQRPSLGSTTGGFYRGPLIRVPQNGLEEMGMSWGKIEYGNVYIYDIE
jgi:hypothetical protein